MSRPLGLALPTDWSMLPCEQRLKLWLRSEGLTLTDLARKLGVHKSAPGKWLVSCTEPLPEKRRVYLASIGMPIELFPLSNILTNSPKRIHEEAWTNWRKD